MAKRRRKSASFIKSRRSLSRLTRYLPRRDCEVDIGFIVRIAGTGKHFGNLSDRNRLGPDVLKEGVDTLGSQLTKLGSQGRPGKHIAGFGKDFVAYTEDHFAGFDQTKTRESRPAFVDRRLQVDHAVEDGAVAHGD